MDRKVRELVESVHGSERVLSLAIAGAGTQAVGWILGVAGASRTALDVQIPYSSSAVVDYVGFEPGAVRIGRDVAGAGAVGVFSGGRSA